jgi:hypothetical protein
MSQAAAPGTNTQLAGPRPALGVARGLWLVVTALVVGLTIFNLPDQFAAIITLCSGPACISGQLSPADVAQMQQSGLSLNFYAAYLLSLSTLSLLVFVVVGAFIFWRRSNDGFGIFAALTLVLSGFSSVIGGSTPPAIVLHYPALFFLTQTLTMLGASATTVFLYLFPDGHFAPRWLRWLVPLVVLSEALHAFRPDLPINNWTTYPEVLSAIFALIYHYWRVSGPVQRQQTKWVVFGTAIAGGLLVGQLIIFTLVWGDGSPGGVGYLISTTTWTLTLSLIPISIGVAILRSRLWDIDILIRRTLVYAALTGLLALAYFGSVVVLEGLVRLLTGQSQSQVVTVVSTLAIAALFVPLRRRVQAFIDRRFYRRKYDAARTLAVFGTGLRDEVNLEDLSAHLLTAVDTTMQPTSLSLWLKATRDEGHTP